MSLPAPYLVFDHVLERPHLYRNAALQAVFRTVTVGDQTFHGIAPADPATAQRLVAPYLPADAEVTLTFFRQSPHHQAEPTYIHSDANEAEWTGIVYLTPRPAHGDGTVFWERVADGVRSGPWDPQVRAEAAALEGWRPWARVDALFGRLLLFQAPLYHSRAIFENYGEGEDARLTQIIFGRFGGRAAA